MALWLEQALSALIGWVSSWLGSLLSSALSWAVGLLPEGAVDFLNSDGLAFVLGFVGDVRWFLPVDAIFLQLFAVLGLVGGIRLVRWILALVPTWAVGGG